MKSIYYIIMVLVGIIILNGCETDENGPMPDTFEEAAVAYMVMEPTSSGLINVLNLPSFNLEGTIDVLFDSQYEKLTLMVAYKGDYSNAGVLIDNITSTPYDFSLDINDVVSAVPALGSSDNIEIGDYFTFYVNVTKGGKVYPVYVMVGNKAVNTISSGVVTALRNVEDAKALTDLRIDVPCGYDQDFVTGNYNGSSASWAVDGPITITKDPNDEFIVYVSGLIGLDGETEDLGPLKMIIDPNSYNVTAVKTVLASDFFGYDNAAYQGTGKLNTCDGTYTMNFTITVDQGSFGSHAFTFKKVQ